MQKVRVSLIKGDLLNTPCSIAFIKHRNGRMRGPEKEIDARMNGKLTSLYRDLEKLDHIITPSDSFFPFSFLYIITFREEDFPFTYSSVDTYARKIVRLAVNDIHAIKIATTIHGQAVGLDSCEALETMLSAFSSELRSKEGLGKLQEIMIVEKVDRVFERMQERFQYLLGQNKEIYREGEAVYLNLTSTKEAIALEQNRFESLSLAPVFVAMPFAKEYNNVYHFGIKGPVEQRKRKCERADEDQFTGDIVARLKERITVAEIVVADTTGHNPNVFYEVGYAQGIGKQVILICQDKDIPFDLQTQRHILYDPHDIMSLANKLGEMLDAILKTQ